MARLLFAENGTIADLAAALGKLKTDTEELHAWSLGIVEGYTTGEDVPFPDRLHRMRNEYSQEEIAELTGSLRSR